MLPRRCESLYIVLIVILLLLLYLVYSPSSGIVRILILMIFILILLLCALMRISLGYVEGRRYGLAGYCKDLVLERNVIIVMTN